MTLEIEKSIHNDSGELARILAQGALLKSTHGDNAWAWRNYTEALLQEWIKVGNTYTVRQGGEVAATFALTWDDATWGEQPPVAGYIHKLAVKDEIRGSGLGEAILDWAAAHVADNGRKLLRLDVPRDNQRLREYYERQGLVWVPDCEIEMPYGVYSASLYERRVGIKQE